MWNVYRENGQGNLEPELTVDDCTADEAIVAAAEKGKRGGKYVAVAEEHLLRREVSAKRVMSVEIVEAV